MRQIENRLNQAANAFLTPGIRIRDRFRFAGQALRGQQFNVPPHGQNQNPGLDQMVRDIAGQVADDRIHTQVPPLIDTAMTQHGVPADRNELEHIIDGRIPPQPNMQQIQQEAAREGRRAAEDYMRQHPIPNRQDIENMIQQALGNIQQQPGGITEARVRQIAEDVFNAHPGLSQQDVSNLIQAALHNQPQMTQQEVERIVRTQMAAHPPVAGIDEPTVRQLANEEITARAPNLFAQNQTLTSRRGCLYGIAGGVIAVVALDACGAVGSWAQDRIRGLFSSSTNQYTPPPTPGISPTQPPREGQGNNTSLSSPVETGAGNEVTYPNISVANNQYLLAQGWKINGTDQGIYEAIKGPSLQTLDITDGSYQIAGDAVAQQQFWSDIRTAMNNNWSVSHVWYDSSWTVPSDLQQFLQGKDVKTIALTSQPIARRQLFANILHSI